MFIQNNNLIIRDAIPSDATLLSSWWNDGKIMVHVGFPYGLGETASQIEKMIKNNDNKLNRLLIIQIDNVSIGEMHYNNKGYNIASVGIKICILKYQEKGYGKQFLSMLINSLFKDFGYKKIIIDVALSNKRACYLYEKLGFRKLSVDIDSWKNQLGELQSSVNYELTKENFLLTEI